MMEKNGVGTEEFGGDSWLPQTRQAGCSGGYRMRNGVCYKAFNTRKNFHDASLTCVADGGTLAMPKDAGTNGFLLFLKNAVHRAGWFWFGLVDQHREGGWEWIDGTPLGFRAWGPGEPNNAGNEDCAEYFPTAWNDAPCSRTDRKFICQKIPAGCPGGYIYHQPSRQCYKAFNEKTTYSGAVAKCSADGGTLAMPRGPIINKFLIYLKNAVDKTGWFRFGLTDHHQEGGWKWANNIPLGGFRPWAPGEPNNLGNEDCAEYFPGSHAAKKNTWNDGPCTFRNRKFICQVSPRRPSVLRRVCEHQTLTTSCPAGRQINIVSALYGRTSRAVCPSSQIYTTNCRSPNSLVWVRGKCQGRSSCSVRASNSVFGDPCRGTVKYLEVRFTCIACSGKREMPDPQEPEIGEAEPQEPEAQEPEPEQQEPEIGEAEPQEPEAQEPEPEQQESEIGSGEPDPQEPEPEEPDPQEPEPEEPDPQEPEVGEANEVREEDMLEKALEMLENEVRNEQDNLEYGLEE
ncbi:PREDICTED: macrophage mannose receptor 1-like [Branchiostoma belcheri]|uniref:Macrophage mannose receptor 1-like n=1 Tax=Branchiostoma belcheri TaxID=7741 RepID=A0A6P4ZYA8_BRABE|nr:PREDICTED: macrophage mannose receptor 1-like [Branchiostoma belcheri]